MASLRSGEIDELPDAPLVGSGPLVAQARARGLDRFHAVCEHVRALPYARARGWASVLDEGRGTCNSKHALLVMLARELGLADIELGLGMFELGGEGFPAVARVLAAAGLPSVLEAHCYLVHADLCVDLTWPREQGIPHPRFIETTTIDPSELPEGKLVRHRAALTRWLIERRIPLELDEAWAIREACIAALSEPV